MSVKVIWQFGYFLIFPVLKTSEDLSPSRREDSLFDILFRWGHPITDFGLNALDEYLAEHKLKIVNKRWTPLLTMYHTKKRIDQ